MPGYNVDPRRLKTTGLGSRFAEFIFRTAPRGDTAYIPDPFRADPAHVSKWSFESTPTTLRMIGKLPASVFVGLALVVASVPTIVVLWITGVMPLVFAIPLLILLTIVVIGIGKLLPRIIAEHKRRVAVVLEHDEAARSLTLHGESIDPGRIDAVERVRFATGLQGRDLHGVEQKGTSFTTRVHLLLRERLDNTTESHPTSLEPGVRFHIVACSHVGLRPHGRTIAERLGVPFHDVSIGSYVYDPDADDDEPMPE